MCLIKLNDFYDFIELCHSSNRKFEAMYYEFESTQQWQSKSYGTQKHGVIVASRTDCANLTDCTDVIVPLQCKENSVLPLETLEIQNCILDENIIEKTPSNSYDNTQTVLRRSDESYRDNLNEYSFNNAYIQPNFHTNVLKNYTNEYNAHVVDPYSTTPIFSNTYENAIGTNVPDNNFSNKSNVKPPEPKVSSRCFVKENAPKIINKKRYACPTCNKTFIRKLSLNSHMSVHTNIKPFTCSVCSKQFSIRSNLTSHQRLHTNVYKCRYCSKSFTVPSKLERHERIHKNERPYACSFENCGKTFSDKRNLVGHEATHSNVRDFVCELCSKSYKTKSQLNDHKRTHVDDARFKCDICGKSYKWKTNLMVHLKKHNGYQCNVCKKDCERLSVLIKHRKECKVLK